MLPRLNKQIQELRTAGYTAFLLQEQGLSVVVGLCGPEGTPYEGGNFYVKVILQNNPFKKPKVFMMTPTYHPNLLSGDSYEIPGYLFGECTCCYMQHIIKKVLWSPIHKILQLMPHIIAFFKDPTTNPEYWQKDFQMISVEEYKRRVEEWIKRFSKEKTGRALNKIFLLLHLISYKQRNDDMIENIQFVKLFLISSLNNTGQLVFRNILRLISKEI